MSTACAHFPQSSRVHSALRSLERRVTPAYLEVKMQNSCNPYHHKNLLHNTCPAATPLAPHSKPHNQQESSSLYSRPSVILLLCISPSSAISTHPPVLSEPFRPSSSSSHLHTWLPWGQEPAVAQPPHHWNSLPRDIQHSTSITTFKSHLKIHLFRQAYYYLNVASLVLE